MSPRTFVSSASRQGLIVGLVGLFAVGLAACSSTTGSEAASSSPAASGPGTVKLVTYDAYAISESVLADFTKQTGIKVEVIKAGDAGEVVNRAILTEQNPEGNVLFGVDNNLLSRAIGAGLFQQYQAQGLDQIPAKYRLDPTHQVTPIDVGDVCINYDKNWFKSKNIAVPTTMDSLADPKYKDLLVVENPATSSPGLAFMLATVAQYGEDGYLGYWTQLKNNGAQVVNDWSSAYEKEFTGGSASGKRPLVVSYSSSPAAAVVYADPKPANGKSSIGVMDQSCYRQIEFAGVLANAQDTPAAQKFVDFMITDTYQNDLPLQNFVFPVQPSAKLPKVFTDNAVLVANPLSLPPEQVAANRDRWVAAWTDTVVR